MDQCYNLNWYSYTKRTFSGPLAVIEYLGRYTHRIAISNHRILSVQNDTVTILVKDYKNNNEKKTVKMKGVECIRRLLMHILPRKFVQTLWTTSESKQKNEAATLSEGQKIKTS
uniref:transposase n=1 Tax=Bacillus fonticola TaxID=2728853 RepID=UPI001D146821|nr:transposase [Bacillus fonticola]